MFNNKRYADITQEERGMSYLNKLIAIFCNSILVVFLLMSLVCVSFLFTLAHICIALVVISVLLALDARLLMCLYSVRFFLNLIIFFFSVSLICSSSLAKDPLLFSVNFFDFAVLRVDLATLSSSLTGPLRFVLLHFLFFFFESKFEIERFIDDISQFCPSIALILTVSMLMMRRMLSRFSEMQLEFANRSYANLSSPFGMLRYIRPLLISLTYEAFEEALYTSETLRSRCYGVDKTAVTQQF